MRASLYCQIGGGMISTDKRQSNFLRDQRGAAAMMIAVALVPLLAFAGLGIDVGIWYDLKRQMQSAVDNGAFSGAMELAGGKGVAGGPATADIQNLVKYATVNNLPSSANTPSVATGCTDAAA